MCVAAKDTSPQAPACCYTFVLSWASWHCKSSEKVEFWLEAQVIPSTQTL